MSEGTPPIWVVGNRWAACASKQRLDKQLYAQKGDDDVITSETLFSYFIAEHNLPFTVADHFSKLCKQISLLSMFLYGTPLLPPDV